ncbi:MAG: DUF1338 domain-containing protein [Cytophagaceae bacterium]|nr:DUF1338 domain-containing protein [Cytophagaceae bacterium]
MNAEAITERLLDRLWAGYCNRVPFARTYAELVRQKGGTVVNDHCAFRTFNTHTGQQTPGFTAIGHVLESLGYMKKDPYHFLSKHLNSFHYEHPSDRFPKFFVSQLEVHELPEETAQLINQAVADTPSLLAGGPEHSLAELKAKGELSEESGQQLVETLVGFFTRPWVPPLRSTVETVNKTSQFGAWTLLHGNSVNHFTAYINHQHVADWPDIEATIEGLKAAGVPMKPDIEGERGSKLRQSSTQAVTDRCAVREADGSPGELEWTYAYYELAERGYIEVNGERQWFNGFLGEQATNLFEMTKNKE